MTESKDDVLEYLKSYTNRKEETDRELVQIETRLEEQIKEVKTDLKDEIARVEKYLRDDINGIRIRITALTVLGVTSLLTLIGFGSTLIIRT